MEKKAVIIGAGLAGLSAALELARAGIGVELVSLHHSERAQSVMAEGGINAALDTKGEGDSAKEHFSDSFAAGRFLADEQALKKMTLAAPDIISELFEMGVCFNTDNKGNPELRNFGGQKKKRTAFAGSESGKQIMTALTDAIRKYEANGIITRYPHHEFVTLIFNDESRLLCRGALVRDTYTGEELILRGNALIMACGGMHGLFNNTTGSAANSGAAACELYRLGAAFANLEFIQFHPTTAESGGKMMLISEAARGEGGRLFADTENGRKYFMEEKYPELGNLMPRDITSREIYFMKQKYPVYLDMSHLPDKLIDERLAGIAADCKLFLNKDIKKEPVEVMPAIHYFMGGIYTDASHRTNIEGLYAAGECCCLYHGANRLGGNSLLGAVYGGKTAAASVTDAFEREKNENSEAVFFDKPEPTDTKELFEIRNALSECMGVARSERGLKKGLDKLKALKGDSAFLARAFVKSALEREESRGAHFREDFPNEREDFCRIIIRRMGD